MTAPYKSPLHQTVTTTATDYWNDSCSIEELTDAIEHGAVGATTNPTIVLGVVKKEAHLNFVGGAWRASAGAGSLEAQGPATSTRPQSTGHA
jgi:transaldolase